MFKDFWNIIQPHKYDHLKADFNLLYYQGYSALGIAELMISRGTPHPEGKPWTWREVRRIYQLLKISKT